MQPFAGLARDYALCAKHRTELICVRKRGKHVFQLVRAELFARFHAPARKYFVGVVVVVMTVVVIVAMLVVVLFVVVMTVAAVPVFVLLVVVMTVAAVFVLVLFIMVMPVATMPVLVRLLFQLFKLGFERDRFFHSG